MERTIGYAMFNEKQLNNASQQKLEMTVYKSVEHAKAIAKDIEESYGKGRPTIIKVIIKSF